MGPGAGNGYRSMGPGPGPGTKSWVRDRLWGHDLRKSFARVQVRVRVHGPTLQLWFFHHQLFRSKRVCLVLGMADTICI